MSVATVFLVAGIGGIFAFGRDLFQAVVKSRRKIADAQQRVLREPLEVHGMVIENTKEAMALQTAVMVDLRLTIEQERREGAAKDILVETMRRQRDDARAERDQAVIQLARLRHQGD